MSDPFETALDFVLIAEGPLAGRDGLGWFRRLAKVHQFALRL
jgi:hypothetical protein